MTKSRVDSFYSSLASEDKTIVQTSYQRTRKQINDTALPRWADLTPKERFISIAVGLRALLYVANKKAAAALHVA